MNQVSPRFDAVILSRADGEGYLIILRIKEPEMVRDVSLRST